MQNGKWFITHMETQEQKTRLIAFHHAGGSASAFRCWQKHISSDIALCPAILPSHDSRVSESYPDSIQTLAETLVTENEEFLSEKRLVIYGHSMGAVLAFETAAAAQRHGIVPYALIVSGETAPKDTVLKKESRNMNEQEFIELLRDYAGMDIDLLENKEFMKYYYPIVRGDFIFYESYVPDEPFQLQCPICVINGREDKHISMERIEDWKYYSSVKTDCILTEGGHFFSFERPEEICGIINEYLSKGINHE